MGRAKRGPCCFPDCGTGYRGRFGANWIAPVHNFSSLPRQTTLSIAGLVQTRRCLPGLRPLGERTEGSHEAVPTSAGHSASYRPLCATDPTILAKCLMFHQHRGFEGVSTFVFRNILGSSKSLIDSKGHSGFARRLRTAAKVLSRKPSHGGRAFNLSRPIDFESITNRVPKQGLLLHQYRLRLPRPVPLIVKESIIEDI